MDAVRSILIVGLGLIGSSVARAARLAFPNARIEGLEVSADTRRYAQTVRLVDQAYAAWADIPHSPHMVVVATPVNHIGTTITAAAHHAPGALITDAGSVKRLPLREASTALRSSSATYIPAHPIAGSEKSGPEHGFAELLNCRRCILTPEENTPAEKTESIRLFWQTLGMDVESMSAEQHDRIYALVSHLPQQLSFDYAARLAEGRDLQEMADFMRLTRSNPRMWQDIFAANADYIEAYRARFDRLFAQRYPGLADSFAPDQAAALACALGNTLLTLLHEVEHETRFPLLTYAGSGFHSFISLADETCFKPVARSVP